MLTYEIDIELSNPKCEIRVNEFIHPSMYLDMDELKRLNFKIFPEKPMDVEIPAEKRELIKAQYSIKTEPHSDFISSSTFKGN